MGRWKKVDVVFLCWDFGTSTYYFAVLHHDGLVEVLPDWDGLLGTPAVVGFEDGDPAKSLVGLPAVNYRPIAPHNVTALIKSALYDHGDIPLLRDKDQNEYSSKQLMVMVLRRFVEHIETVTGKRIGGVVITSPACTSSPYRQTLQEVADAAKVKFLGVVHEPVAALLGHLEGRVDKGTYMVVDVGGGTSDVSIMRVESDDVYRVLASAGKNNIAGNEFKSRFMALGAEVMDGNGVQLDPQKDLRELVQFERAFEEAKKDLSTREKAYVSFNAHGQAFDIAVTRQEYEGVIAPVLSEIRGLIMEVLGAASLKPASVDGVLLAGGAARTPAVKAMIIDIFGETKLREGCDKDQAVVRGGALTSINMRIKTLIEQGDNALKAIAPELTLKAKTLVDVLGTALGVRATRRSTGEDVFAPIVPKSSNLPCEGAKLFGIDGAEVGCATDLEIRVLQGNPEETPDSATELAVFPLNNLPPGPVVDRIEVAFNVDANGIVAVKATDRHTGQEITGEVDASRAVAKSGA